MNQKLKWKLLCNFCIKILCSICNGLHFIFVVVVVVTRVKIWQKKKKKETLIEPKT
jgi:hypothetical protein